jgi:hypothetical protein
MNYKKMYAEKTKRIRDPNLPPPPTLLGQVKDLRLTKEQQEQQQITLQQQQAEITSLRNKLRTTEYRLDLLTNLMRQNRK